MKETSKLEMIPPANVAEPTGTEETTKSSVPSEKILPVPEQFSLTQVECLEVKNIELQRQLLQKDLERLMLEEQLLSNKISSRVRLNINNYIIDPVKAMCVIRPEVKQQLLAQQVETKPALTEKN